jgi:hypothetical protein
MQQVTVQHIQASSHSRRLSTGLYVTSFCKVNISHTDTKCRICSPIITRSALFSFSNFIFRKT